MKKTLLSAILTTSLFSLSMSALAQDFDFENYQLNPNYIGAQNKPFLTVRLSNDFAANNLVLNNNIRNSILKGYEYQPRNENFEMPTNNQILSSLSELERVYNMTGLKLYVIESYNGFQDVVVTNSDDKSINELIGLLSSTNLFDSIDYFEFNESQNTERALVSGSESKINAKSDGVGVMSVINTGAFNDPFYPEQAHFGRQGYNSLGSHSFEAAIQTLKSSGVMNGRKVNVAVIDSGYIEHEDIKYAQTKDFVIARPSYRNYDFYDGHVYLNKNRSDVENYRIVSSYEVDCDGYFLNKDGQVIEGMENQANQCFENFKDTSISLINPEYLCKEEYGCYLEDWVSFENDGRSLFYRDTHGIEVAGLIGAISGNNKGITGIIPSENLNLIGVSALIRNSGVNQVINKAVLWAAGVLEHPDMEPTKYPAQVINMSLGGGGTCNKRKNITNKNRMPMSAISEYLYERDILIVAAAGNDYRDHFLTEPSSCSFGMSVGALDAHGRMTYFSNHGFDLDVMAYGESVITTTNRIDGSNSERMNTFIPFVENANSRNAYGAVSGTSFSAPITSGLVGLLKLADPTLSAEDIIQVINSTATRMDNNGNCYYLGCGNGSINAEKAVNYVLYGEMTNELEANHFLYGTDFQFNENRYNQLSQYGDICNRYRVTNGISVENGNFEYTLYGSNGDGYSEIGVYKNPDFIFNDEYSTYKMEVRNNSTGNSSGMKRVSIDRTYRPSICN